MIVRFRFVPPPWRPASSVTTPTEKNDTALVLPQGNYISATYAPVQRKP